MRSYYFIFLLVIIFFYGLFYYVNEITTHVFVTTDIKMSFIVCNAIVRYYCINKKLGFSDSLILVQLKKIFPFISSVSIRRNLFNLVMKVAIFKPRYYINKDLILTENKCFFPRFWFDECEISALPFLLVSNNCLHMPKEIFNYLNNFSDRFILSYFIHFLTKEYISFVDQADPFFVIISSFKQPFTADKLYYFQKIKDELGLEYQRAKSVRWAIDMRFANYIVAYKKTGGVDGSIC